MTSCDECGRSMEKAHRVYRGVRYCQICYIRVFKPRLCPRCGERARLPRHDPRAVCRRCEVNRPCARCGKTGYRVGRITPYGPVCKACARYFRPLATCAACGSPSYHLVHQLCPRCAAEGRGTCQACRRHRRLQKAPDGRSLCRACLERGEVPCPSCGRTMPAGRGRECEDCYWRRTFEKRLGLDLAALARPEMQRAFSEFGAWLLRSLGPNRAALRIHRYLPFFLEVEERWGTIPSYPDLLEQFGSHRLRRVLLVMRWLEGERGLRKDPRQMQQNAEKRRVETLLAAFPPETPAARCLQGYWENLKQRVESGRTSLLSARLALRPAVSLLVYADPGGSRLPDQKALERYLLACPGQKSALSGFLGFLRNVYGLRLQAIADRKATIQARRQAIAKDLIQMAAGKTPFDRLSWVRLALAHFHGLRLSKKALKQANLKEEDGGLCVGLVGGEYWIPLP